MRCPRKRKRKKKGKSNSGISTFPYFSVLHGNTQHQMQVMSPAAWCLVSGTGQRAALGRGSRVCTAWSKSRRVRRMVVLPIAFLNAGKSPVCFIWAVVSRCLPLARGLKRRALQVSEQGSTQQWHEAASWWNHTCPAVYVRRELVFVYIPKFAVFYCSFSKRINCLFSSSISCY